MLLALASCEKKQSGLKVDTIAFDQAKYEILETYLDLNLRKKLVITPSGIVDTCKITWKVSDPQIAEMSGSYVIPLRAGDVKITATVQGKSATCTVEISEVPIEDVTLTDFTVELNNTKLVPAVTTPEGLSLNHLQWSIDDPTIAEIDSEGNVTGLKEGTTKINATDGGSINKSCNVTVKKVAVESIKLNIELIEQTAPVGTVQLIATVKPDNASFKTVEWKSSDETVATVDENGNVELVGMGEANITATADGMTATCKVKIAPIKVTYITLNTQGVRFSNTSETFQLTYTLWPENVSASEIVFESSDKNVATVDNKTGLITCKGNGAAKITCTDKISNVKTVCVVALPETSSVTALGYTYPTVKIGTQWWMAENLKQETVGSIPFHSDSDLSTDNKYKVTPDLSGATKMSYSQKEKAGMFFSWTAATGAQDETSDPTDSRGICPSGWEIPSRSDIVTLRNYLLGLTDDDTTLVHKLLASTSGWVDDGIRNNGFDVFGFNALPTGQYDNEKISWTSTSGQTIGAGHTLTFWTRTHDSSASGYGFNYKFVARIGDLLSSHSEASDYAHSVRCIKKQ